MRISYAYFSEHVVDESGFRCDAKTIECRMDIHVRRVANISDMNVQVTGIAAVDKVDQHVRHDAALLMVGWFGVFGSSQCDGTFASAQLLQIPPGQESLATKVNIRRRCGQEFGFGRRAGIAKVLEFKRESPFDPDRTHYKS